MNLHDYLKSDGALSAEALAKALGIKDAAQVRQWKTGLHGRKPSAKYCVLIEKVTRGAVRRQDLRPNDWHEMWPDLVRSEKRAKSSEAKAA